MLAALTSWLFGWGKVLAVAIINFLVDMVNAAIVALVGIISTIADLLPTGTLLPTLPSLPTNSVWVVTVQCVSWLFPVSFIISALMFVTSAILSYAVIAPLARWAKLLR